jgi:predicted DNA-binding protein
VHEEATEENTYYRKIYIYMTIFNSMATTIQLPIELKKELDLLKDNSKMTYAELLKKMIENEKKNRNQLLLKDYAKKYGKVSLKETKEWKNTEIEW